METQMQQEVQMNSHLIIIIALVYAVLCSKLVDRYLSYRYLHDVPLGRLSRVSSQVCQEITPQTYVDEEGNEVVEDGKAIQELRAQCFQQRKQFLDNMRGKKLTLMLVVGTLGMMIGSHLVRDQAQGGRLRFAGFGMSLGGVLIITYNIIRHWMDFAEDTKIIILSSVFFSMVMTSYRVSRPLPYQAWP